MTELSVKTIHFAHSYGFCERKYNSILTKNAEPISWNYKKVTENEPI